MFKHGKNAVFKLDNAADVLTDISSYLNSVNMPRSADTDETSVLGQTSKTHIPGMKDGTISIEGNFDPTVDEILDAAVGAEKSFEYGPQGSGVGSVKYTGQCICTSFEPNTNTGARGTFTAQFQLTDDVARGTYA